MSRLREIAGYAGKITVVCAVLLAIAPVPAAAQQSRADQAESATSLYGSEPDAPEVNFPRVSYLDPNLQQPQQSIQQFAEAESTGFAPLPCGPLKNVFFTTTWLRDNDLGFTDLELTSNWGWFNVKGHSLLTLTPGLGAHFVDGPIAPDLPAQLYDLSLDVKGLIPFSETFAIEVGLTPGLFSDFENGTEGDAFRFGARVVGYYSWSPTLRLAFGASYLDRFDVEAIPVGGIIWTPDVETQLQLTFPRAKFARRRSVCGSTENWWYIAADFNGGSWAIERTSGAQDTVGYRDLRLVLGWERRTQAGPTAGVEAGLVFNRRLEYKSGGDFELDETVILRGTVGF